VKEESNNALAACLSVHALSTEKYQGLLFDRCGLICRQRLNRATGAPLGFNIQYHATVSAQAS
jgi:hypothetical protein